MNYYKLPVLQYTQPPSPIISQVQQQQTISLCLLYSSCILVHVTGFIRAELLSLSLLLFIIFFLIHYDHVYSIWPIIQSSQELSCYGWECILRNTLLYLVRNKTLGAWCYREIINDGSVWCCRVTFTTLNLIIFQ